MVVRRLQSRSFDPQPFAPTGSFVPVYRADRPNSCPGCSRSNWIIGRISAECGFCGTALPIASPVQSFMPDRKAA